MKINQSIVRGMEKLSRFLGYLLGVTLRESKPITPRIQSLEGPVVNSPYSNLQLLKRLHRRVYQTSPLTCSATLRFIPLSEEEWRSLLSPQHTNQMEVFPWQDS